VLVDRERGLNPPFISWQSVEQMVLVDLLCLDYFGLIVLVRRVVIGWLQYELILCWHLVDVNSHPDLVACVRVFGDKHAFRGIGKDVVLEVLIQLFALVLIPSVTC